MACVHGDLQANTQPGRYCLMLLPHQIVVDGDSTEVMLQDLAEIYSSLVEHRSADLDPCPVQYPDYTYWQRKLLKAGQLEKHISFWMDDLRRAPLAIDLPTAGQRPAVFSSKGAWVPFELSEAEVAALLQLAKQLKVTLLETVLSAIQVSCVALLLAV